MSLLTLRNVSFAYAERNIQAVSNVSLALEKGEYVAVLGTNGSGKSTLCRLMAGFLSPDSGEIVREEGLLSGLVFQCPGDQIVASVVEADTGFGPVNLGCSKEEVKKRTVESLSAVGLLDAIKTATKDLSQGQKQKLGVAGIAALHPHIIFLDESTSMVDPVSRKQLLDLLDKWHQDGQTIIHVTHDAEEACRANRIVVMENASVIFDGDREEFISHGEIKEKIFGTPLKTHAMAPLEPEHYIVEENALVFDNLDFSYGKEDTLPEGRETGKRVPESKPLFKDFSLCVKKGCLTALMGPSGCGKSTLLEIAAGLLTQQKGCVSSIGRPLLALQDSDHGLFEEFAADEVAFGPRNQGFSGKDLIARVECAMDMVGLPREQFGERQTYSLSGGEKRKLSLSSIIAMEGDIILFDEPTAGLDAKSRKNIIEMLQKLVADGKTVLFTTHREEEAFASDYVIRLEKSRPVSIKELLRSESAVKESKDAFTPEQQDTSGELKQRKSKLATNPVVTEQPPLAGAQLLRFLSQQGSFRAGNSTDSLIKKISPLGKYMVFLSLFVFSLVAPGVICSGIAVCISFMYAILAGYPLKKIFLGLFRVIPWLILFFALQIFFLPVTPECKVLWSYGVLVITDTKLLSGALMILHLTGAFVSLSVFVYSITEQEILEGLEKLLFPLKYVGVPIRHVSLIVGIIFRFVPLLAEEAALIIKIQLIRGGLGETRGIVGRIKILIPLVVPLILRTLKKASILAEALNARYYS